MLAQEACWNKHGKEFFPDKWAGVERDNLLWEKVLAEFWKQWEGDLPSINRAMSNIEDFDVNSEEHAEAMKKIDAHVKKEFKKRTKLNFD